MIKLDEWCDIPLDEECTCESYLHKHLISPLHIDNSRYFTYGNQSDAAEHECQVFSRHLENYGPIDLVILGLGLNGHLGLIEPNLNLKQHVHVSRLSETTKKHAMLGKSTYKPDYGITLGIADIFNARRAVLLVAGRHKKNIVAKLLKGNISTQFPASLLWLHGNAELIISMIEDCNTSNYWQVISGRQRYFEGRTYKDIFGKIKNKMKRMHDIEGDLYIIATRTLIILWIAIVAAMVAYGDKINIISK